MPTSKVLFLDMDGVLCTMRSHKAFSRQLFMQHLDLVAVRLIEKALQFTGAKLVLSSTWREHYSCKAMTCILMNSGFEKEPPWHEDWKTPVLTRGFGRAMRGNEIQQWLTSNPSEKYAILDDDNDMLTEQQEFFVRTNADDGLLWADYQKIVSLLE